jgi:hypothetical protein
MTKEEVAEILRVKPSMVHRIGLKKTRIGNGRGKILYRKQDVIHYINSKVEGEEAMRVARCGDSEVFNFDIFRSPPLINLPTVE